MGLRLLIKNNIKTQITMELIMISALRIYNSGEHGAIYYS